MRTTAILCVLLIALSACAPKKVSPLGTQSFRFYGSTPDQNRFNNAPGGSGAGGGVPPGSPAGGMGGAPMPVTLKVKILAVDTSDKRFGGTPADLTAWRNTKLNQYQSQLEPYWKENSYGIVGEQLEMKDEIFNLTGAFDDYFNRSFVQASLTTSGLAGATYPLNLAGVSAVIHVRDAHDRNDDVNFDPNGAFADLNALVVHCQNKFNTVRPDWVTCEAAGSELRMRLVDKEVKEASFVRVKSGTGLAQVGLEGPREEPGQNAGTVQASLTGKPIPAGFPLNLGSPVTVQMEVRNQNLNTRRYTLTIPAGPVADGTALAAFFPTAMNAEFNWVEANAQPDRIGLRIKATHTGDNAAIRIVNGTNLAAVGLDGPVRIDGVIHPDARDTVRTGNSVPEALSLYIARRAMEAGIPISSANQAQIDAIVAAQLDGFDTIMILFAETMTGIPSKRAAASSSAWYNLSIPGTGGFTYVKQRHSGIMIGTGFEGWQTWAHESGHVLGFWDVYPSINDDPLFNDTFDYLSDWSMMAWHPPASHVEGWHKNMRQWLGSVVAVNPPAAGATEVSKFTLAPLEFPFSDYATTGDAAFPLQHLIRVKLADDHWIQIENREPGPVYSQSLPDDTVGSVPPSPMGARGGVLVTDTVDPWSPFLYRQAVTVLNPHGTNIGRGMKQGDVLDLTTTFPAYDGIKLRVVDTIAGPAGKPRALRVEVERGPGDFLDLGVRPWQAPSVYATPDIWIDWPGNGTEDYPAADPPLGNGDAVHWHPDGTVLNFIKVRVHNYGTITATGVKVRAYVNMPMGMGDRGQFVPLPDSAPQDIPPGSFKNFVFEWKPKSKGHTCIRAEILTHTSTLSELVLSNNAAQENIDDFAPSAGSPYAPIDFSFTINSRYAQPVQVRLLPTGLVDGLDVELEASDLIVPPEKTVELRGRLFTDITKIPPYPQERKRAIRFQLHALRATGDSWLPFGGISFNVTPGFASQIEWKELRREKPPDEKQQRYGALLIHGRLKGPFAANQPVDAAVISSDAKSYGGTAITDGNGRFLIRVDGAPPGPGDITVYYFGPHMTPSTFGPKKANLP